MKLVEILARELDEWPEDAASITQDKDGEIWPCSKRKPRFNGRVWTSMGAYMKPGLWKDETLACDYDTAIVTRAEWQAAVDALNKPSAPAWVGVGDPPSGTVCELRHVSAETGWGKAVIAFASRNVIVWDWDGEPAINGLCTAYRHAVEVRPVRTPEQIAAEERLHTLRDAHTAIARTLEGFRGDIPAEAVSRQVIEAMIDAGYRKQEQN